MIFIGVNPSKASSSFDDPTMKRLNSFCDLWGYGSLMVINLFARVSCSPSIIRMCADQIGKDNDQEIAKRALQWEKNPLCDLWLGWGNEGAWQNRNHDVMQLLKINSINRAFHYPSALGPLVLGLTKKGHPRHPLYASQKEVLRPFIIN